MEQYLAASIVVWDELGLYLIDCRVLVQVAAQSRTLWLQARVVVAEIRADWESWQLFLEYQIDRAVWEHEARVAVDRWERQQFRYEHDDYSD